MARFNLTFRDLSLEELEDRLISMIRKDPHIKTNVVRFAIMTTPNPDYLAHSHVNDYERNKDALQSLGIKFLKEFTVIKHRNLTRIK